MDYANFHPQRYTPDPLSARRQGEAEWHSISDLIGARKDQRILEIGCGGGSLIVALQEHDYSHSQGIDADEALVRHGREILGINLALGSWRPYLEKSQEIYDVIIALDVFEHLAREEIMPTLQATRARLAAGGRFILRTPNALCPFALPILYGDLTHQFLIIPRTLEHLLRSAGFGGRILIRETQPSGKLKSKIFAAVHHLIVKPFFGLAFYHFHGEFPSHLTPNIICCVYGG